MASRSAGRPDLQKQKGRPSPAGHFGMGRPARFGKFGRPAGRPTMSQDPAICFGVVLYTERLGKIVHAAACGQNATQSFDTPGVVANVMPQPFNCGSGMGFGVECKIPCRITFGVAFWRGMMFFGRGIQDPLPDPAPNRFWRGNHFLAWYSAWNSDFGV